MGKKLPKVGEIWCHRAAESVDLIIDSIMDLPPLGKYVYYTYISTGARIAQKLSSDPLALDAWTEKESGLIRLYFVFENQFRQIVEKGGIKDVSGTEEGYLSGLPIG